MNGAVKSRDAVPSVARTVWVPADAARGTANTQVPVIFPPPLIEQVVCVAPSHLIVTVLPVQAPLPPPTVTEVPGTPVAGVSEIALAAATYGPTNGPPPVPSGATPAGSIDVVDVSVIARSRLSRPLPVYVVVPTASAISPSRLTMTPLLVKTDDALINAAAPATAAAEAEVPVI